MSKELVANISKKWYELKDKVSKLEIVEEVSSEINIVESVVAPQWNVTQSDNIKKCTIKKKDAEVVENNIKPNKRRRGKRYRKKK